MNRVWFSLLLSVMLTASSCKNSVDFEHERSLIEAEIDLITQAHFEKNATLFYQPYANSWIDIRNGSIKEVTKENQVEGTQSYLNSMEFQQMEFSKAPIIEISNDGTLATYSNTVIVKGLLQGEPLFWVVAWQNVLRKTEDKWQIISAVNTEATPSISAETILNEVRSSLGLNDPVTSVFALANCTDPEGNAFKTLIMSTAANGRMEQQSGARHSILKHGSSSWGYNVNTQNLQDSLAIGMQIFAKSHELHWLSMYPETRYNNATYNGIIDFNGLKVFKISFTDDAQKPVNFYYAFDSYLPIAFDIEVDDMGNTVATYFENWDTLNGVSVFKNATFDQGGLLFKYHFSEIVLNSLKDHDLESKKAVITN